MEEIFLEKNRGFRKDKFIFSGFLFFLFIILFFFLSFVFFITSPINFNEEKIFSIGIGDTLREVSFNLKNENLIRSRFVFESFVVFFGGEKKILPGDYLFEPKLNVIEIADRIATGSKNISSIKITIPEGYDVYEIAEVFSSKLPAFDKQKFIEKAIEKEGYLFPDTYFFFRKDTEDSVLEVMLLNYENKISELRDEINKTGKTEKEILIMASIIEGEASGKGDRALISGVLWKRLDIGMPLQVDVYPITYKVKGLPENPISNPGLLAISSAIYPEYSDYLYYLHGKDGNTYFAKSYEEHRKNINRYLR